MNRSLPLWIGVAVALSMAPAAPAQVRVLCTLERAAATRLESWLAAPAAAGAVEFRTGEDGEAAAALAAAEIDVVIGIDAVLCAGLARDGLLAHFAPAAAAALAPPVAPADDRYTIPWLQPMALAYDPDVWSPTAAPRQIDDVLFGGPFAGQLLIVSPLVTPTPWLGWIHAQLARGRSREQVLVWLRALDVAVAAYAPTLGEIRRRQIDRSGSLALVPWTSPGRRAGHWPLIVPPSGMTVKALAVAVRSGAAAAASRALCERLLSVDCAIVLATVDLLPAPRSDLERTDLPPALRAVADDVIVLDYAAADAERWLRDWQSSVRGEGKSTATLETVLDVLFGAAFLVFLIFVYRRISREETAR